MNGATATILFDGNGRVYRPGETLSGECRLNGAAAEEIQAVELSVLWHTEGKGDEDLAVHFFQRLSAEGGELPHPEGTRPTVARFSTALPNSPLTYDGMIVKVQWCVRVRVFLSPGKEVVGERHFRLGHVRAAKAATA